MRLSIDLSDLGPQLVYIPTPPPFVGVAPPLSPVYYSPADPQLPSKIVNQIDYYFRCSFHWFIKI